MSVEVGSSNMLKMAFVGCGGIADAHWRGIQEHATRINVTAAVDIDSERAASMAERIGGQAFTFLEEALADGDFTSVNIMLPHALHEDAALKSFEAGKHVILEKPMSTTLDSCERIMEAARTAGTVFMIAEQAQYWPDALAVKQLLQDGAIGNVITARAFFGGSVGSSWGSNPWRYDLAMTGGGICIDGGSHWIRLMRMCLGEIEEVVAVTDHPLAEMEGESMARALLKFASGTYAVYDALRAGSFKAPSEEFRVTGTIGEIIIEKGSAGRVLLFTKEHPDGLVISDTKQQGRNASYGYELADFASAVLEGKLLEAGPEYSMGELRTALAIYRSAANRTWEKVWA